MGSWKPCSRTAMASIRLQVNPRKWLPGRWDHLRLRLKDRQVNEHHAGLIRIFFDSQPWVPDLAEAPDGWHKYLGPNLLICGEGEYWKTLYTPSHPGRPRPKSIDLDEWEKRGRKAVGELPGGSTK
jgi:hypothetical protein